MININHGVSDVDKLYKSILLNDIKLLIEFHLRKCRPLFAVHLANNGPWTGDLSSDNANTRLTIYCQIAGLYYIHQGLQSEYISRKRKTNLPSFVKLLKYSKIF